MAYVYPILYGRLLINKHRIIRVDTDRRYLHKTFDFLARTECQQFLNIGEIHLCIMLFEQNEVKHDVVAVRQKRIVAHREDISGHDAALAFYITARKTIDLMSTFAEEIRQPRCSE